MYIFVNGCLLGTVLLPCQEDFESSVFSQSFCLELLKHFLPNIKNYFPIPAGGSKSNRIVVLRFLSILTCTVIYP